MNSFSPYLILNEINYTSYYKYESFFINLVCIYIVIYKILENVV